MDGSKKCPHCDADVDSAFDYCPKCGKGVYSSWTSESDPVASTKTSSGRRTWIWAVAAVAVIAAIIAANTPNPFRSKMEFNDAKFSENFDSSEVKSATGSACADISALVNSVELKKYNDRLKSLKLASTFSPRKALTYSKGRDWLSETNAATQVEVSYKQIAVSHLERLIKAKYPKLSLVWVNYQLTHMATSFQAAIDSACPADVSAYGSIQTTLSSYDSERSTVRELAASVPWYPNGYNQYYEDSNLAWKWYRTSCNLGDSCWHMKVIAEAGCYNGLYGEINILDGSGGIIDYSNDTVPRLGGGQVAVLEFSTYDSNASTGQLARLSCN